MRGFMVCHGKKYIDEYSFFVFMWNTVEKSFSVPFFAELFLARTGRNTVALYSFILFLL